MKEPIFKTTRKRRVRRKTIPHKIRRISIVMFLLILIFFHAISSFISGKALYARSVRQVQTELNGITTGMEQTYAKYINKSLIFDNDPEIIHLLQTPYADIKSFKNLIASQIQSDYQKILTSLVSEDINILDFYLVNTNGTIYCSKSKDMSGKNIAKQGYFYQIIDGRDYVIDDLKYFSHLKKNGFIISTPITYHKETVGVAVTILSTDTFDSIIKLINIINAKYYVTDSRGNIVYSANKSEVATAYPENKMRNISMPFVHDDTDIQQISLDDGQYLIKEATLPSSGWVIRNLTDIRTITNALLVQNGILFSFIILSCTLGTYVTKIICKPFCRSIQEP